MHAIRIANRGPDYRLEIAEESRPVPGPDEVLIKVAAAGVNRADLLQARGRYPPPKGASPILGLEVSGEVVECGAEVSELKPGEKIVRCLPAAVMRNSAARPLPACSRCRAESNACTPPHSRKRISRCGPI